MNQNKKNFRKRYIYIENYILIAKKIFDLVHTVDLLICLILVCNQEDPYMDNAIFKICFRRVMLLGIQLNYSIIFIPIYIKIYLVFFSMKIRMDYSDVIEYNTHSKSQNRLFCQKNSTDNLSYVLE